MSRMYTPARPTRVDTDPAGAPLRLYWRGHWERVLGSTHWRIEDDWWREGGEIKRDYYKVWTADALVAVVYRDGVVGGWYVEKIMD